MLAKFNSTITLKNKFGVIIPSVDGLEKPYIERFQIMLSDMFGGASTIAIDGYYVMEDGSLCNDKNIMVYAYYNEMTEKQEEKIVNLIQEMKVALNQECIGIEYQNQFTMVF